MRDSMKVKYTGNYSGISPLLNYEVSPGDIIEVDDEVAEKLISSGQFKKVRTRPPKEKQPTEVPGGD
jgi:hypothetical protein